MKTRLEPTTCDTIMTELDNWRYDAGSDQLFRELLDRSHQVSPTIPDISGQSRTSYK